jgi:hypothetical protein
MRIPSPVTVILPLILLLSGAAEAHPHGYMQRLQNDLADRYHLPRFKDIGQLKAYIKAGKMARVEDTDAYRLDATFGEKDPDHRDTYAHVQPWTKAFLDREIGAAHAKFGTQYVITSLVRTQKYQNMLCHGNANAICGGYGWKRSAHLTGATVDIGRLGLTEEEQDWLEHRLNVLWRQGKLVYIAEAGQQYCLHIMVLPTYLDDGKVAVTKRHTAVKRTRHRKPPHDAKRPAGHRRHKARH